MNAMAEARLQEIETERPEARGRTMEFLYKSGSRPLDGYTIKRGLGRGGFGEVYYAISDGGKEAALKLVQRYLDVELRGVSHCLNLKSPHLVSIFDVRQTDSGENWIVMEYMSGASLQERLEQLGGKMPLDEVLHWLSGIASAIDYLHQNGIVHRDLKPGNVFSEQDIVKVGDYGLSKFISNSRRSGQTQSVGTVHYMAPEISTGKYGRGIDIYSAAVMAFEMLAGDVPFDGETAGEILMKHLTAEPSLHKVDERYRPIFQKALAKVPEDRYQSVRELYLAIHTVGKGEPAPSAETTFAQTVAYEPAASAVPPALQRRSAGQRLRRLEIGTSMAPPPGTFKAKRRALSELLWSMFLAGVLTGVISLLMMTAEVAMGESLPDMGSYVQMGVLSGFACWGILVFARWWEMYRPPLGARRLNMLLFGLAVGALAMGLDIWLGRAESSASLERWLKGPFNAQSAEYALPTAVIYLTIGALAFAIPDWAKSACRTRAGAFSVWRAIWAGSVGTFLGVVFSAPEPLLIGGTMAVTCVVVQWVSPHELSLARRLRRI